MKERKNGIETKKNIFDNAKRMFYENGYNATKYEQICEASNVNAGTMYYHFGNKKTIASKIYSDFFLKNRNLISENLKEEYTNQIYEAVEIRSYLKFLFMDRKFLRFFYDIYIERIPNQLATKELEDFYQRLIDEFKINLEGIDLKTITVVASGFQSEFVMSYYEGFLKAPIEDLTDYYLKMRFRFVQLTEQQISHILAISKEAFSKFDISLSPYFEPIYKRKLL